MRIVNLPSGNQMPVFGLGTWRMGERSGQRGAEVDAIRHALDLGVRLIDTAEMYGDGGAEQVVGEAISGRRDDLFVVSKVYPHNASRKGVVDACERSLRRLKTGYIDLYLLHWPGDIPILETLDGFHTLLASEKIRDFGVSNFDLEDLEKIPEREHGSLGANQVLYNLAQRQPEWAVVPWCRERRIPVMAYSPLDQGGPLLKSPAIRDLAEIHQSTTAQIALAWLLHREQTVVIPKSSQPKRIEENFAALEIQLREQELLELDQAYPAPTRQVHLGMR